MLQNEEEYDFQNAPYQQNLGFDLRVGGKFRLGRKIGSGSFGDIYVGI